MLFIESKQSQTGKHLQVSPSIEFGKKIANNFYLGALLSWRYSGLKSSASQPIINFHHFNHQLTINNYMAQSLWMGIFQGLNHLEDQGQLKKTRKYSY